MKQLEHRPTLSVINEVNLTPRVSVNRKDSIDIEKHNIVSDIIDVHLKYISDNQIPEFNRCYENIKNFLNDQVITEENLLDLTVNVISIVQKYCNNDGHYKKKLVINLVIKMVLDKNYPNENLKNVVLILINGSLPPFIDVTVALARGELNIGKK